MFVRECHEAPGNTLYNTCVGSIANIYSLYDLTFNLAMKTVEVGLYVKLNLFYTFNTVLHILIRPIVLPVYVYAVYFYITTFTKMTHMYMQCSTLRMRD